MSDNDTVDVEFSIVPTRGGFWLYKPRATGVTGRLVKAPHKKPAEFVRPMGVPREGGSEAHLTVDNGWRTW